MLPAHSRHMSKVSSPRPLTLGIDLGTSAVKVVALADDGTVLGKGSSDYSTISTLAQQAEQDPDQWLRAAGDATSQLHQHMAAVHDRQWSERIVAIGLTGQLPTLVVLHDGVPVGNAITWKDGRADSWAAEKVTPELRACMYQITGMPIDGRYLAPMLRFHFADRHRAGHTILSAKDYLLFRLTGLHLTDPSTAAGYGIFDHRNDRFHDELAQFWDVPVSMLPPIKASSSHAGPLHAAGAAMLGLRSGIPVGLGAADSVCAAFAMSGLDPGAVSISLGSSAIILGATCEPRLDARARYLLTPHVCAGWHGREMDLLATGTGYRWLSELFGWRGAQIDVYAAQSVPGARGLFFAPYLAGGEQGALWNPRLRGALLGLGLHHSRSDIARAFLEGVFFEIRRCIDVLAETAAIDRVVISGNIATSVTSTQLLADVLQLPVHVSAEGSPAAVGAALLARHSAAADWQPLVSNAPILPQLDAYSAIYEQYLCQSALCG